MLRLFNRSLRLVALCTLLAACGDDSGSGPPPYPDVEGTYQINGTFAGVPGATFAGTMTLLQASRNAAPLTGSATVNYNIGGQTGTLTGLSNGSVTQAGVVRFDIANDASGTWQFTGTLNNRTITGSHTLSSGGETVSGTFTAVRP